MQIQAPGYYKYKYLNEQNISSLLENFIKSVNSPSSDGLEKMINGELKNVFGFVAFGIGDTPVLQ